MLGILIPAFGMNCIVVDITKNFFELFQLPVSSQVDLGLLSERYRELQKAVHPDRFAADDQRQQRLSAQYAAHVNEAMDTLKSSLKRSIYLLQLAGKPVDMENNTIMDAAFLMEQMELRDRVSEVREHTDPESELEAIIGQVEASIDDYQGSFDGLWQKGDDKSLNEAENIVKKMQFMVKLAAELEQLESELLDD